MHVFFFNWISSFGAHMGATKCQMPNNMLDKRSKICQIKYQNTCKTRCHIECKIKCWIEYQITCQNICPGICQIEFQMADRMSVGGDHSKRVFVVFLFSCENVWNRFWNIHLKCLFVFFQVSRRRVFQMKNNSISMFTQIISPFEDLGVPKLPKTHWTKTWNL